jgi:3-hydroxyisobutyrate dehydrogenase-like beta-hydroxyacid dehydrogenase
MNADTKPRIGFIGLGLMGHEIAKNIVTKGFPLTVRVHGTGSPSRTSSPPVQKEVKTNAEVALTPTSCSCASPARQVESIVHGDDGLLAAAPKG